MFPQKHLFTHAGIVAPLLSTVLGGILLFSAVEVEAVELTVDFSRSYQEIEGWGTAIVPVSGNHRNAAWRAAYRDLGLNIMRIELDKRVLAHSTTDWATPVELTDDLE
ncbi:MAG: hypothetical protein EA425_10025 [Puniceicoccaceae bacterium]|nr:MAG: hypothetical protein EA425_10025 [Puniceicoccaceae bacterium]